MYMRILSIHKLYMYNCALLPRIDRTIDARTIESAATL